MKKIVRNLYSMSFARSAYKMLVESDRITVHEYRNFVDFDLIPFVRKYIEKEMKKSHFDITDKYIIWILIVMAVLVGLVVVLWR